MSSKLLLALSCTVFLFVPGVALADPPDLCTAVETDDPNVRSPGAFTQAEFREDGSIGQQAKVLGPANLVAADANQDRKANCPPPKGNPQ